MSRTVFQDGRVLRTSDFVADQADHLARHRRHNIGQHRWGIVAGLGIVLSEGDLTVEPGHAVDGYGRDVVLTSAQTLDLRSLDTQGIQDVEVWLVYDQERLPAAGDGVDRLSDSATVEPAAAIFLSDVRKPPGVPEADLTTTSPPETDDPGRRWPIYLGLITRDLTEADGAPVINLDKRPYAGLVGATVESPDRDVWIDLGAAKARTLAVRITGADGKTQQTPLEVGDDGLRFEGRLTVNGDLTLRGGALTIEAGEVPDPLPDWSLSHAKTEGNVPDELCVTLPAGSTDVPTRLVVGAFVDGTFQPSLVIGESGTVVIAGNLEIGGHLRAASIRESSLNEEARNFIAGAQAGSLLSLFTLPLSSTA
ncbi:hypothetical protein ACQP2E_12290 [Actinoplanes sp. CA-015351]|uniref:hypothetical protein n=1 Tax=Actinoplanes sp. CA-015351 TaxID=3239897 RepID=UPI003D985005